MAKRLVGTVALLMLAGSPSAAQEFPPGFVDPAPLLAAVTEEIGEADLRCVSYSGSGGYAGAVGQTFENAVNIDWPHIGSLDNYTRTINWEAGTNVETFDREPGLAPASWKYGLGWRSGTPTQTQTRQTHVTNGKFSWHMDGDGAPVAVHPEIAEVYQLDMWLNPHGFLKAARMPGANPVAFWRWEQIEKGRDGNVVMPEKMHVVAIEMFGGKYRVDATINSRNLIQRIKTTVNIPALGDFNVEHEFTDYATIGNVKWPTDWSSHQGWDDNWQFYRQSTGHNSYGGSFPDIRPNDCGDPVPVPEAVAEADWSIEVTIDEIADGVYRLGRRPRRQLHDRVRRLRGGLRGARGRGAQPARHRRDYEAGARQADPLGHRVAPALRPHRGPAHLPARRVDHRHPHDQPRVSEPRRAELRAANDQAGHRLEVAADGAGRGLQLRGGPRELRHHRQLADPPRLLRAAASARRRHADGVPAGRAHCFPVGPVRHARAAEGRRSCRRCARCTPRSSA